MTEKKIKIDLSKEDRYLMEVIIRLSQFKTWSSSKTYKMFTVGKPRASRICNRLRELGIIGPDRPGGLASEVLIRFNEIEFYDTEKEHKREGEFKNFSDSNTSDYKKEEPLSSPSMSAIDRNNPNRVMDMQEYCEFYGIDWSTVKSGKLVTHTGTPYWNLVTRINDLTQDEEWREKFIEDIKNHSPKYKTYKRESFDDPCLLLFDAADIHIGKYSSILETGVEYNVQIALQRVEDGTQGILKKASGFNIDRVCAIIGNDVLHTDTPKTTTTSGTHQDTVGLWHENFLHAKKMYVRMIETLMESADVDVIFNPSNHDWQQGFCLAQTVAAHFHQSQNVTFNVDMNHRKYFTYGNNLIGTTHGDSCKLNKLPLVMATEASEDWAKCKRRYWYTHHVHSKHTEDFNGVTVESVRSPSEADGWHSREAYVGSPKAIEAFIHDFKQGQVARLSHYF